MKIISYPLSHVNIMMSIMRYQNQYMYHMITLSLDIFFYAKYNYVFHANLMHLWLSRFHFPLLLSDASKYIWGAPAENTAGSVRYRPSNACTDRCLPCIPKKKSMACKKFTRSSVGHVSIIILKLSSQSCHTLCFLVVSFM